MIKKIIFCLTLLCFFTQSLSVVHAAPCGWDGHKCAGYCTSGTCTGVGDTCICWPPPTNTPINTPTPFPCTGRCYSNGQSCPCGFAAGECQGDDICCKTNCPPTATATPTSRPKPTPCQYDDRIDRCVGDCDPGYECRAGGDSCGCVLSSTTPIPSDGGCRSINQPCTSNNQCCEKNCFHGRCQPIVPCTQCHTVQSICQFQCETCATNKTNSYKIVSCWASQDCKNFPKPPCSVTEHVSAPYWQCPYQCAGVTPTPSSAPVQPTCQPMWCYDMSHFMCNTPFGGCPDGIGHCDNCGGKDCGRCDGGSGPGTTPPPGSTPTPTSPPDCIPNCVDPNVSPCITTTCYNQTCQGNCGQYCYGTFPGDCSCATNLCSDQTCQGSCGECPGQLTCVTPTLDSFEIRRSDWSYTDRDTGGTDIMDGDNRIHICDPFIANSSNPRRLIYVAWVSTSNGWQDIASVQIRWLRDYVPRNMVRITRFHDGDPANDELPNNRDVYYLIVDFDDSHNHTGNAYDHQINITSVAGSRSTGWLNADRLLKVWDCHVSAQGGFFDSAGQPACTMTTPMPAGMVNDLAFGVGSSTVPTNITGAGYSVPNLHFAKSYLPYFNGGNAANIYGTLAVTSHATKVNNASGCISGNSLRVNEPSYGVDPYDDSTHQLQVDFAFSRIMDPWYQIIGSGLRTRVDLNWAVPATAPAASRFLTMSNPSLELDHGSVFYGDRSLNSNGYNGAYSPVPNWHARTTLGRRSLYNYSYLYNRLFEARGIGTTGTAWNHKPATGPFFVNGDLLINQNNSAFAGQPLLTIVSGNLTVSPTVTQLYGLFMVDGNLDIGGSNATPLTLTGSVYTRGNARLHRSLVPNASNNSNPAVIFRYQPGYMLNLPPDITKVLSGWRAE